MSFVTVVAQAERRNSERMKVINVLAVKRPAS